MRRARCVVMKICDCNLAGVWGPGGPQKLMGKCCKILRKQLFQGLIISFSQKCRRFAQNIGKNRKLGKNRSTGQPVIGLLVLEIIFKGFTIHGHGGHLGM